MNKAPVNSWTILAAATLLGLAAGVSATEPAKAMSDVITPPPVNEPAEPMSDVVTTPPVNEPAKPMTDVIATPPVTAPAKPIADVATTPPVVDTTTDTSTTIDPRFTALDKDGDSSILQSDIPGGHDLSTDLFASFDTNQDQRLSSAEFAVYAGDSADVGMTEAEEDKAE